MLYVLKIILRSNRFSENFQINFKENLNADGIKVIYKDGSVGKITARKEVILCAGVINTPQLLLLSGIGSAEELDKFQVTNRSDSFSFP